MLNTNPASSRPDRIASSCSRLVAGVSCSSASDWPSRNRRNEAGTILGGTPTTAGTYTVTVSGTDWDGVPIAPMTYQITVVGNFTPPPVTITAPRPAAGS